MLYSIKDYLLSYCLLNIPVLSTQQSIFYTYDQTVAKKGSDEVASIASSLYYKCTKTISAVTNNFL